MKQKVNKWKVEVEIIDKENEYRHLLPKKLLKTLIIWALPNIQSGLKFKNLKIRKI